MPRLAPSLFHRARCIDPLLPLVLRGTRDVTSAKNELRWLREHVIEQHGSRNSGRSWRHELHDLCMQRARGKPLQYLLGSEYFGDLEIACRPGVLIPRQETATSVTHLVERLHGRDKLPRSLRILDLCTGTGCIPLLLHHELLKRQGDEASNEILGVDISPLAIDLARRNLSRLSEDGSLNLSTAHPSVQFLQADVLADTSSPSGPPPLMAELQRQYAATRDEKPRWDILVSNPPYISPDEFNRTTSRSVRNFEPRLALVPNIKDSRPDIDPGDIFYPRLLETADQVDAKVVLFEVADMQQASRVAFMIQERNNWSGIEIWRDDPTHTDEATKEVTSITRTIKTIGSGNGRSVFAWRGEANEWLSLGKPS